ISGTYRILPTDSASDRAAKAYKWVVQKQIKTLMPKVKPTPNTGANFAYYQAYIDDVVNNNGAIGYRSYVSWCLDSGRDQTCDSSGDYAEISVNSPNFPYHSESTAGGTFSFPPSEQPTHAERRS